MSSRTGKIILMEDSEHAQKNMHEEDNKLNNFEESPS